MGCVAAPLLLLMKGEGPSALIAAYGSGYTVLCGYLNPNWRQAS